MCHAFGDHDQAIGLGQSTDHVRPLSSTNGLDPPVVEESSASELSLGLGGIKRFRHFSGQAWSIGRPETPELVDGGANEILKRDVGTDRVAGQRAARGPGREPVLGRKERRKSQTFDY